MIGARLNHYEIVRKLGSGGMGDVYAARDTNLGREVALKILPAEMARDEERLERFRREATAVAALDHPNIVTIFSIEQAIPSDGEFAGENPEAFHFLTMQLVEGRTLDEFIPRRGLSLGNYFDIAVPLADAVAAAHEKGITHRDLKPTNIMVAADGRVKVLDFGLAKLAEETEGSPSIQGATMAATRITEEGKILGTAAYMSPEQAEGHAVDHRTDIFSLGIILYEMATGEAPFQGDSRISVLSSVVNDEPEPLTEVNRSAPRHLGRIVGHSLEKDPKRRFQSALDLRNELAALEREIDSGQLDRGAASLSGTSTGGHAAVRRHRNLGLAAFALLGFIAVFVAYSVFSGDEEEGAEGDSAPGSATSADSSPRATPISAVDNRPSIAVLYFDNGSGDEDLDWLRTGLPEMLVTDLSQSRSIRVLTTDRVYSALSSAGVLEAGSSEALAAVGGDLDVDRVLLGSILRAGGRIRIVARLQDMESGEILASETLEGDSEEDLFDLVDELTNRIRTTFTGLAPGAEVDRDLTDVTTSSVEALRLWIEADRYANLALTVEAREVLLRAVQIDPEFGMAYAKLAAITGNMGDVDERRRYSELALEHADRLTERERLYIEGGYYYGVYEEAESAVAAFQQMLDFDPSSTAARNNLALSLQRLGRYDEAIAHFEVLVENEADFIGTWTNLADLYADMGRFDEAEEVLLRLAEHQPESAWSYDGLAQLYLRQGDYARTEDAAQEALRRGGAIARRFLAGIGILTGDWEQVESIIQIGALETEPSLRFGAIPFGRSDLALYRGDSAGAIAILQGALDDVPERGTFSAWLTERLAYVHEGRGDMGEAARLYERALEDARTNQDLTWILSVLGRGRALAGDLDGARSAQRRLEELTASWPETLYALQRDTLAAAIAVAEGDFAGAVALLESQAALLTPSGADDPPHCYVWIDLAQAHIAAGNPDAAVPWLERIATSTTERTGTPLEYVTALRLLGKIYADAGDTDAARDYFELFLEHWGEGDLVRDEVAAARSWLAEH